ncbi:putative adenylate kinase 1, chloroplastic [Haematococcus lacustris]
MSLLASFATHCRRALHERCHAYLPCSAPDALLLRACCNRHYAGGPPPDQISWVFLGPPGVGKGTYASRMSKLLGVSHIATGDLIRDEMKAGTPVGKEMQERVNAGKLVPDAAIFKLLQQRLEQDTQRGLQGFILDGFPRTQHQAETLLQSLPVRLALNMSLAEEVLVTKCLGRRLCKHCGRNYNVATIDVPATGTRPRIWMPPLNPPPECAPHLEQRADDTEPVIRRRLQLYNEQASPVESVFKQAGLLEEFEILSGIPETMPRLLEALRPHIPERLRAHT